MLHMMGCTELHCVQLFMQHIRLGKKHMLHEHLHAIVYFHVVRCVLHFVEWYFDVFDYSIWMPAMTADVGSQEFGLPICLGTQGGSQISTGKEDITTSNVVFVMLSEGFGIELSDFEAENATLKGYHLQQVVEIVIGGSPTVLEICFIWVMMSFGRILLQSSLSTNLFD